MPFELGVRPSAISCCFVESVPAARTALRGWTVSRTVGRQGCKLQRAVVSSLHDAPGGAQGGVDLVLERQAEPEPKERETTAAPVHRFAGTSRPANYSSLAEATEALSLRWRLRSKNNRVQCLNLRQFLPAKNAKCPILAR